MIPHPSRFCQAKVRSTPKILSCLNNLHSQKGMYTGDGDGTLLVLGLNNLHPKKGMYTRPTRVFVVKIKSLNNLHPKKGMYTATFQNTLPILILSTKSANPSLRPHLN